MSLFKKPKRNVRQRQTFSDDEEEASERNSIEEDNFTELQSNIERFKQGKKKSNKKKENIASSKDDGEKKSSLLSFDNFEAEADDGEIFKVKKSSQSRKLMKQIKAERKKQKEKSDDDITPPLPPHHLPNPPLPPTISSTTIIDDDEIGLRVKNNLVINKQPQEEFRTLTGYEAEAIHMEEEDEDDSEKSGDEEKKNDPLQDILQSGAIPDATAIFQARKRRQALREKGETISSAPNQRYISLTQYFLPKSSTPAYS